MKAHDFDAADALWSDRKKAQFRLPGNLDGRFAATSEIAVDTHSASRSEDRATVEIEIVETDRDGSSRRFIGSWDVVLADGRWLLDQPHLPGGQPGVPGR